MKNFFYKIIMALAVIGLLFVPSCKDDDGEDPTPEFAKPTIIITSPDIPDGGLNTEAGSIVSFTIKVEAEAGLSTLTVGTNVIKTFSGTETSEEVTYDYLALEAGALTLSFVVEDAQGEKASIDVLLNVAEGEDLGYLLIDFAGDYTSTVEKIVVDWDVRQLYTFNVTGSHGTSATAEVVNSQAQLTFAQDNPDTEDNAKVFKIEKTVPEGFDNWGGWPHVIFGLGSIISEETINALPTWDNTNVATVPGTKVIKLDAYYDATIDPEFTWSQLLALTDIWGADPSQGYKLELALAAYDPMGIAEGGHDGPMYIGYLAYINEPNKWVTLTFELADESRIGSFYGVTADPAPGPGQIDCVKILPSGGYIATDLNLLYIKNLRIVDVE